MIVKCVSNRMEDLPERSKGFAMAEDMSGDIDISVGKSYIVYAMKIDAKGSGCDYFVHTDTQYQWGMQWMPSELYEIVDDRRPEGWAAWTHDDSGTSAGFPSLMGTTGWLLLDDDQDAAERYLAEAARDPSFPTEAQLDEYNRGFYRERRLAAYREAVRMAEERGWEWSEEPDDLDDIDDLLPGSTP